MLKTFLRVAFGVTLVIGLIFFLAYNETHYTRTGYVKKVNNNVYSFTDGTGNDWEFYSDTIIPINAVVSARFFTNNTIDNIKDDMLIDYDIISYLCEVDIEI